MPATLVEIIERQRLRYIELQKENDALLAEIDALPLEVMIWDHGDTQRRGMLEDAAKTFLEQRAAKRTKGDNAMMDKAEKILAEQEAVLDIVDLVNRFTEEMLQKLLKKHKEGLRGWDMLDGWMNDGSALSREQVIEVIIGRARKELLFKSPDPVDIANFAAFAWWHKQEAMRLKETSDEHS